MINVSAKRGRENQNTHFMFNNIFFFENRAVYEIMCKNVVQPGRPQMTIARLQIHINDYVIFIAFPLQKYLQLHSSMLLYTYTVCLLF